MERKLILDDQFDIACRNSPSTTALRDAGASFFMLGEHRMAMKRDNMCSIHSWNTRSLTWEDSHISLPNTTTTIWPVNGKKSMAAVENGMGEVTEIHPITLQLVHSNGTVHLQKETAIVFPFPISSVVVSFDTDYLFTLTSTHVYLYENSTTRGPRVNCALRSKYRGLPVYAMGSSLFFRIKGDSEHIDEYDGERNEWARWTIGQDIVAGLPNISDNAHSTFFSSQLLTLFAVCHNGFLWSLDPLDPFWTNLGDLRSNGGECRIESSDGRSVYVNVNGQVNRVIVVEEWEGMKMEEVIQGDTQQENATTSMDETIKEKEDVMDGELKCLYDQIDCLTAKIAGHNKTCTKFGVMLHNSGATAEQLRALDESMKGEKNEENETDGDPCSQARRKIVQLQVEEGIAKKKILKMTRMLYDLTSDSKTNK